MTRLPPPGDPAQADLAGLLGSGDALIVVPPVTALNLPALGPHLLQAWAARAGFRVRVFHGQFTYATAVGDAWYDAFCRTSSFDLSMPGERIFARVAHGLPALGRNAARRYDPDRMLGPGKARDVGGVPLVHPPVPPATDADLARADRAAQAWVESTAQSLAGLDFPVVGCSCSYDQVNASLALLRACKRLRPDVVTVLGGANCAGAMAEGILSLDPRGEAVDHVFQGESERTFTAFLEDLRDGRRPAGRIVAGHPLENLDEGPAPDFADFERQADALLPARWAAPGMRDLTFEASRGCYRGERGHCRFCGLNGEDRAFRRKSGARVAAEVADLAARHPGRALCFADNVLPDAVLGPLADAGHGASLLACLFPRVSEDRALRVARAGFTGVMLGVEALDTSLLDTIHKGSTAADNVLALRHLKAAGVHAYWNLLWGLPGDDADAYRRTLDLLPRLRHLDPPRALYHLSIDRSSPYFDQPAGHGIRDVRPLPAYRDVYPDGTDVLSLANHHLGDYDAGAYRAPDVMRDLVREVEAWQACWASDDPPRLAVLALGPLRFVVDTRGLPDHPTTTQVSDDTLKAMLAPGPLDGSAAQALALARDWGVALDGGYVPLVVDRPPQQIR